MANEIKELKVSKQIQSLLHREKDMDDLSSEEPNSYKQKTTTTLSFKRGIKRKMAKEEVLFEPCHREVKDDKSSRTLVRKI